MSFLPMTRKEFNELGWLQPDFTLITGDAYVDHPSFGAAIIARYLEKFGYKVCIIAQPDIKTDEDFTLFGEPRLGFLVTAGNIDSMINHFYVSKKRRKQDEYSPNGAAGLRPDRATIKYCHKLKSIYPNSPIIIGGIEASLRRLSHYDYWDNKVRRSILLDSKADLLVYGMSEKSIIEVADALDGGLSISDLVYIRGTVFKTKDMHMIDNDAIYLPSYDEVLDDKKKYVESFQIQNKEADYAKGKTVVETYKNNFAVCNPPNFPLSQEEMDEVYAMPFMRQPHPIYSGKKIPAIEEISLSIISNRGCFGSCNFCALTFHQGKTIQSRSKESIVCEAKKITQHKEFKGYIHDVGGPTANFYKPSCKKQLEHGSCTHKECIGYTKCNQLEVDHTEYVDILREVRSIENVKKVFIRSGIRYDYLMYDKDNTFFNELVEHHISGQLKVAPEHIDDDVLVHMNKPGNDLYDQFVRKYNSINKKFGKNQFVIPYLMSSHPGSTLHSAIKLAQYLNANKLNPRQVQDFYPTPGTASTTMFYTGINPYTNENVYVPRSMEEKAMQRALIQYRDPKNKGLVIKALKQANREDLIGNKKECLVTY